MYFIAYSYNILCLLARMLFGLAFSERKTAQLLKNIETKFNGRFSPTTFKKIKKFQGIQQYIINDSFAKFENRTTNTKERENNKLYFVLASLYDDLMDENIVSQAVLNEMFLNPENAKPKSFSEVVLIDTHLKLLNLVQNKEAYQKVLNNIHQAQIDSLEQLKNDISLEIHAQTKEFFSKSYKKKKTTVTNGNEGFLTCRLTSLGIRSRVFKYSFDFDDSEILATIFISKLLSCFMI